MWNPKHVHEHLNEMKFKNNKMTSRQKDEICYFFYSNKFTLTHNHTIQLTLGTDEHNSAKTENKYLSQLSDV